MNVCPLCGSASYGEGCRRCSTGLAGSWSGLGDSARAAKSMKEIKKTIKEIGKTQEQAILKSAEIGLQAQEVHESGELAKTGMATLLKWGILAGGVVLTALIAFGAVAATRKQKGRT